MSDTILKFISDLEELEKKGTPVMAVFEKFPGSIAREFEIRADNGILFRSTSYGKMKEDAELLVHSRNALPKLLAAMRILVDACEWYGDNCENKVAKYTTEEQVRYSGELAREALARVEELLK